MFKWRRENLCSMSTSSIKHRIGRFHVVVVQWTSKKKCTKERDARQSCCFAHKTNCFLTLLWLSSSSLLKVPNVVAGNKLPNVSSFIILRLGEALNALD